MRGDAGRSAVTGAGGFLGQALHGRVVADGEVSALFRRHDGRSEACTRRGCDVVVGDLNEERAVQVKMNRFIVEIGRVTGRRAWVVPRAVDRVLCMAVDQVFRLVTGTSLSPSLVRPVYFPHAKASESFGYAPRFSLADGVARLAELYRRELGSGG